MQAIPPNEVTGLLSAVFSGAGLLAGLRIVFQAGKIVERVEDHERRLKSLEERTQ